MTPPPPLDPMCPESRPGDDFESSREGLRCFLKSRLAQDSDIEDCLQSVSLKWLQHRDRVPSHAMRAWLFTVAANEAALHWRKASRTNQVLESLAHQPATSTQADEPPERVDQDETRELIRHAIGRLPSEMRAVVELRMEMDATFEQIAKKLGIPLGTALSRMHRALARLERELENLRT